MKHCANPDCPGREKFDSVSEFNDTATACSDCGGPLTAGPAPQETRRGPEPDPDLELVAVMTATSEADIAIIESLLTDAGIPYLASGEQIQDLFGIGRLVGVNPITGPVIFSVAENQVDDAVAVLENFRPD